VTNLWTYLADTQQRSALIQFINGLLDAELSSWPATKDNQRIRETWLTARKWLSGLGGIEDLAFWDLDPARITAVGSVLHAIDAYPLKHIQHGAVIGTDNGMPDIINVALRDSAWYVKVAAWFASRKIDALMAQAGDIYKSDAICFAAGTPGSISGEYMNGVPAGVYGLKTGLAERAHDFVIPSVSQLLTDTDSPAHLGNLVNPTASHLTGAMRWDRAGGETDEELVVQLINRLKPAGKGSISDA
jgi:hypothetical protein